MKRVVSVSLGSSSRDHAATVELLGQTISIERIGTDGDARRAKALYEELDGNVDCLGVGGAVLSIATSRHSYPLTSAQRLVRNVRKTPVVDGDGFKNVMELQIASTLESEIGPPVARRVLIPSAMDRMGMARSFAQAGYDAAAIAPIVRHLPMSMLYPTGTREDVNEPRFTRWFEWASVIAGDCNYITHHMPADMSGKMIATNTTTQRDVSLFAQRGVTHLITSTPRIAGRTFGTNVMEAVLVALAGKGRPLDEPEVRTLLDELGWKPNVEPLQ